MSTFAAIDLGASSGRVMLGRVGAGELALQEVGRFPNGPVEAADGLHWDLTGLYDATLAALRTVGEPLAGIGVDSWAVDYGLVRPDGSLSNQPFSYRDGRGPAQVERVHRAIGPQRLYELTGLQFLPFNTIYQLAAEPSFDGVDRMLLIADLITFWLTGQRVAERTNASTTGLLDVSTGQWSRDVPDAVGVPRSLLPELVAPGTEVGAFQGVPVRAVGSHDTASAVVGVPARSEDFAYISCGTWGLVGVELTAPVLTAGSRAANFTNEAGVDDTVRYLRNVMGLWVLHQMQREWPGVPVTALVAEAADAPAGGPVVDIDDAAFLPPGPMSSRLRDACGREGVAPPATRGELVRCFLDSLAAAFARGVHDAARLSGKDVRVVHLVGGGARNELLCQLTADACGLPVVAGPVEATAAGNVLVQARAAGALGGDLAGLRRVVAGLEPLRTYRPRVRAR